MGITRILKCHDPSYIDLKYIRCPALDVYFKDEIVPFILGCYRWGRCSYIEMF